MSGLRSSAGRQQAQLLYLPESVNPVQPWNLEGKCEPQIHYSVALHFQWPNRNNECNEVTLSLFRYCAKSSNIRTVVSLSYTSALMTRNTKLKITSLPILMFCVLCSSLCLSNGARQDNFISCWFKTI